MGESTRGKISNTLRRLWQWWKRIGKKIGDAQARLLLTLFYLFVLGPFALLLRWRSDPLAIGRNVPPSWQRKEERKDSLLEQAGKQF